MNALIEKQGNCLVYMEDHTPDLIPVHTKGFDWKRLQILQRQKETENLVCTTQEQVSGQTLESIPLTKQAKHLYVAAYVRRKQNATHINLCSNLAVSQYQQRNDKLGRKVQWNLRKPKSIIENSEWDFSIQRDKGLEYRWPEDE